MADYLEETNNAHRNNSRRHELPTNAKQGTIKTTGALIG